MWLVVYFIYECFEHITRTYSVSYFQLRLVSTLIVYSQECRWSSYWIISLYFSPRLDQKLVGQTCSGNKYEQILCLCTSKWVHPYLFWQPHKSGLYTVGSLNTLCGILVLTELVAAFVFFVTTLFCYWKQWHEPLRDFLFAGVTRITWHQLRRYTSWPGSAPTSTPLCTRTLHRTSKCPLNSVS